MPVRVIGMIGVACQFESEETMPTVADWTFPAASSNSFWKS